jgi:acetolactate synthase-1/2/3 large subunit
VTNTKKLKAKNRDIIDNRPRHNEEIIEVKNVQTVTLTGAEAVANAMGACGVNYFFYVMGGMNIYSQIEAAGVHTVLCRNEKSATNMADGYARVTKKPTVCYSQHGAAAAILASMLYEPTYAHSPVVALTGSYPVRKRNQWSYQECYEMKYFEPTCKFNVDVTDVSLLAGYMRTAIQVAVSGCPGPTHVNMPVDMATATAEMPAIQGSPTFFRVPPFRPRAEADRIAEAATLLIRAERPVIVCGSGVHLSEAYDEVRTLAEILTIPVVTNPNGRGCFPEDHPLYAGVMGVYGRSVANDVVREADLVFFVATRAGRFQTEEFTSPVPGASTIIHLNIDPVAIGRNYQADVPLVGDAKMTLQELVATLETKITQSPPKRQRLQAIAKAITAYENAEEALNSDAIPVKPQRLMKEISKVLTARDIYVSDTGRNLGWALRFLKLKGVGVTFLPVGGTLGSSLALALGASFGVEEDQRVLNVIGDGGMGYNIAEFETARRYNDQHAPYVALVNNNSVLGSEAFPFEKLNYAKIAEAFGCFGVRVERPGEIGDALREAFNAGKPALVDVVTDPRESPPARARYLG